MDFDNHTTRYGYQGWWTRLHILLSEVGPGPTPPAWFAAEKLREIAQFAANKAEELETYE